MTIMPSGRNMFGLLLITGEPLVSGLGPRFFIRIRHMARAGGCSNSYLGNVEVWNTIAEQLSAGHNVVLLANHQTEADPAVMALMLEASHPRLATDLTYVAGDRVVLDPFCKPFSMGRNLLCVFSKKRINDVPEFAKQKQAANIRTLKEMARLIRGGGNLIWIAPSGGRDRPDPTTDKWVPVSLWRGRPVGGKGSLRGGGCRRLSIPLHWT